MDKLARTGAVTTAAHGAPTGVADRDSQNFAVRMPQRKWRVQGLPGAKPVNARGALEFSTTPNVISGEDPAVIWLGPREWLVVASESLSTEISALLVDLSSPACFVSDMTDGLVTIDLTGPGSTTALQADCALDLEGPDFGSDRCAQTLYAQIPVLLHRTPTSRASGWRLYVDRSLARYLCDWLADRALWPVGRVQQAP